MSGTNGSLLRVGVVGCGNISMIYMKNARLFRGLEIVACADIRPEAAQARAIEFDLRAMELDALFEADDLDLIVNLSVPSAHHAISIRAIRAGKHVFTEKPLCATTDEARELLEEAGQRGLHVGSAPDTFLGAAGRVAREICDSGTVGDVVTGTAFVMGRGMEHWHPNPSFYYQPGAGPVLDMGPYYVTMLTYLLGPVRAVTALTSYGTSRRQITAPGPLQGTWFDVGTPTTALSLLQFHSGAAISFGASWDVFRHSNWPIELHGTGGSLRLPDPDNFGDVVAISLRGDPWDERAMEDLPFGSNNYPFEAPDRANYRGLGLAEMADAIVNGRSARASGALAFHVLEVLESILVSGERRERIEIVSRPERPALFDAQAAMSLLA